MLERTKTLGDAIAYLEHLLARDGRIHLMTGHKAKGLEFDTGTLGTVEVVRLEGDAVAKAVTAARDHPVPPRGREPRGSGRARTRTAGYRRRRAGAPPLLHFTLAGR